MTNLGTRLAKCGVIIGEEDFKQLLIDRYNRQYSGMSVEKFLCNPSKAISYVVSICRELGRTPDQLPATVVLETLLDLRNQGAAKSRT